LFVNVQNCPEDIKRKLLNGGFSVKPWCTFIINLQKPQEELWQSLKKEARNAIKKTKEAGCIVRLAQNEEDFRAYYRILKSSRKELGFYTLPYKKMKKQWEIMHPDNYQVFMVFDSGKNLIAAMGVMFTDEYMIEIASAKSSKTKIDKIYPNDLLKWEIILWGKNKGIHYYDLAGANPNPEPGSKDEGIYRFKSKWGGDYHDWLLFERYNKHGAFQKLIFKIENMYKKLHGKP
jgi:lipid II:glycine glycyltransferase (peptidoglycan interpeptide bridge formation enzyme)